MESASLTSQESQSNNMSWLLVVGLLAMAAAAKAVLYGPIDPDLFLHLIAAEHLVRDGVRPIVDQTSYMSTTQPWTPYSWLAEIGMKGLLDTGGHRWAVTCFGLMSAALVMSIGWACRQSRKDVSTIACAFAVAGGTFLSLPYLSFRPVTLALDLLAICGVLIYRDRKNDQKTHSIWLLIPLATLIVNIHLFAILLPTWLAAICVGDAITHGIQDRRVLRGGVLAIACGFACLLTPMLPGAIASIFRYQFTDPIVAGGMIAEFAPFYASAMGKISLAIVLAMLVTLYAGRARLTAADWLSVALACALLLRMGRLAPVFAIIVCPLVARCINVRSEVILTKPLVRLAMIAVLLLGVVRLVASLPPAGMTLADATTHSEYPVAAVKFVETKVPRHTSRIVNDYSWGGYLAWRLEGQFKVFLTGNTPAFPIELWNRTYFCDDATRQQTLAQTNADAAIVSSLRSPFAVALTQLGWTVAYSDERAKVLVPPATREASLDAR